MYPLTDGEQIAEHFLWHKQQTKLCGLLGSRIGFAIALQAPGMLNNCQAESRFVVSLLIHADLR